VRIVCTEEWQLRAHNVVSETWRLVKTQLKSWCSKETTFWYQKVKSQITL